MKDRFLVRYWVKGSKKYLNSNKLIYNDGTYTQVSTKQLPSGKYISYILYDWNISELIPEQCTGLKDKNGKLIYENDIIKTPCGIHTVYVDSYGLWTAVYMGNPFLGVGEWSDFVKEYLFDDNNPQIEVIGNINENPDLLEQSDVAED